MRKAKIICTMGPASRDEPTLGKLVAAGMDCARLNFSHGTHEDHARAIANVRRASEIAGRPIAILLDLQGPKIRVGKIKGGKVKLEEDTEVTIVTDDVLGTAERFSCSYAGLPEDVTPGDPILVNDGAIRLEVVKAGKKEVRCRGLVGGILSDNKGINLPGTPVSIPALTDKDLVDLQFGLSQGVDYVAMSFVRSADDIRLIKRYAPTMPIIAKLEKPQAVDRIDEISQIADGVMIARGDLGVEMPLERVPLIQKNGIERTNYHGKIAIVATQMLESMIVSPQPTRAEVSDVANAILDGADSVMLSAETATGAHPVEAVRTMAAIIEEVERSARYQSLPGPTLDRGESTFATAVARACAAAAQQLGIGTICVYTRTGETARQIAEYRPQARIVGFTASDVANAILDGADSVMLSAETATGAHPVEAVRTMAAIIEEVERSARYQALPNPTQDRGESTFATAVAKACAAAAGQLGIGTVCVYTRTGETARQIGEYRPTARILAFTASQQAYQRMALYWGVTARRVPKPFESTDEMIANIAQTLVGAGDAMRGEAVIIASAVPPNRPTFGASMMQIHRL